MILKMQARKDIHEPQNFSQRGNCKIPIDHWTANYSFYEIGTRNLLSRMFGTDAIAWIFPHKQITSQKGHIFHLRCHDENML